MDNREIENGDKPEMKCKYCGVDVGRFYSSLEEHLWKEHREIMMRFLESQTTGDKQK
jgi:hypothetical protein